MDYPNSLEIELQKIAKIINKTRLSQGWNELNPEEILPSLELWHEEFTEAGIPLNQYENLYQRTKAERRKIYEETKQFPPFTLELILAGWLGDAGLKNEIELREYEDKITGCELCSASGWVYIKSENGGGMAKCRHDEKLNGEIKRNV